MEGHDTQLDSKPPPDRLENDKHQENPALRPLSGPGASRQTRRLQLRNSGFRASSVPPPRETMPATWSTSDSAQSSDAENRSPSSGQKSNTHSLDMPRSRSDRILSEIGNNTKSPPKKTKSRVPTAKLIGQGPGSWEALQIYGDGEASAQATIRPRTVKVRGKVQKRRSMSAETTRYIEHLETELAEIQVHVSNINSPNSAREHSARMRALHSENQKLQQELAEYEMTMQEQVAKHCEIESGLRLYIRTLENNVEEANCKSQEVEQQVDKTKQQLEAIEEANLQLEKRVEIMSDLLAQSPTKIDLHTDSGPRVRRPRPQSTFFRFPMAPALQPSPDRGQRTQPSSPVLGFSPTLPVHSMRPNLAIDTSCHQQADMSSDTESVVSDAPTGDSIACSEALSSSQSRNPWMTQAVQSPRSRPTRRMRKFGAGSNKPKPLILSSASQSNIEIPPASAPLKRSDTIEALMPDNTDSSEPSEDESPAPRAPRGGRHRASTTANAQALANLEGSTLPASRQGTPKADNPDDTSDDICPSSVASEATTTTTTKDYSSLGSGVGRNLMEELAAARLSDTTSTFEQSSEYDTGQSPPQIDYTLSTHQIDLSGLDALNLEETPSKPRERLQIDNQESPSSSTTSLVRSSSTLKKHKQSHSRNNSSHTLSVWARFRLMFGDLCRRPVEFARFLIERAQSRMSIPAPLLSVQWWLVSIIIGPMARRRNMMAKKHAAELASRSSTPEGQKRPMLQTYTSQDRVDGMAYGTMCVTPPASPMGMNRGSMIGPKSPQRCGHKKPRHSPFIWLRFSMTLAFAVGVAFKDGPETLMPACPCGVMPNRRSRVMEAGIETGRSSPALMA